MFTRPFSGKIIMDLIEIFINFVINIHSEITKEILTICLDISSVISIDKNAWFWSD